MMQTLLFGIDLEFALLSLDNSTAPPSSAPEGKLSRFLPLHPHWQEPVSLSSSSFSKHKKIPNQLVNNAARMYIARTFNAAHLPALSIIEDESIEHWMIAHDGSVFGPDRVSRREFPGDAEWVPMEIESPALPFTPDSLALVQKACVLLKTKYFIGTNKTCGLHVHVSGGVGEVLEFKTLRNLMRFLWAFEPQMDSLHLPHRQANLDCKSLRFSSVLTERIYQKYGFYPTSAIQGVVDIGNYTSNLKVLNLFHRAGSNWGVAYNTAHVWGWTAFESKRSSSDEESEDEMDDKPTIKFRQHEGTLDAERICSWISLLMGIVMYCQNVEEYEIMRLLTYDINLEKWQKTDDVEHNADMLEHHGPISAESTLTIIDVLSLIKLPELAAYYATRLYPVVDKDSPSGPMQFDVWEWEYESNKPQLTEELYEELHYTDTIKTATLR